MKRAGISLAYWIGGLVTTWFSCWIGSRIEWRVHTGLRLPFDEHSCREIDLCSLPWTIVALLVVFLVGPSLAFAFAGWRISHGRVTARKLSTSFVVLVTPTMLLYIASYVVR